MKKNVNIETDGVYNYNEGEYYLSFQNGTRNWRAMHDKHLEDTKIELEEELEKAKKAIHDDIISAKNSINSNVEQVEAKVDVLETKINNVNEKVGNATDATSSNTLFGKLNRLLDRWI